MQTSHDLMYIPVPCKHYILSSESNQCLEFYWCHPISILRYKLPTLPNFQISTLCLYTFNMNYRQGTVQAKHHHHGRNINANVSVHVALNTFEHISPINAHWWSSHINYLVDSGPDNPNSSLLDCKDAKCIVCSDIAPVF